MVISRIKLAGWRDAACSSIQHIFCFETLLSPELWQKKLSLVEDECLKMCSLWLTQSIPNSLSRCIPFLLYFKYRSKKCHTQNTCRQTFISESVSKLYQSLFLFLWQNIWQKQLKRCLFWSVVQGEHGSMEKEALGPSSSGSLQQMTSHKATVR